MRNSSMTVVPMTRHPVLQSKRALSSPLNGIDTIAWAALVVFISVPLIAALYLAKSAMGINVFPGPSPLHNLLYQFIR